MKYKKLEESDDTETADHDRIELASLSPRTLAGGDPSEGLTEDVQLGSHANGAATGGTLANTMNDSGQGSYEERSEGGSGNLEETAISVVEPPPVVDEGNWEEGELKEEGTINRQAGGLEEEGRGGGGGRRQLEGTASSESTIVSFQ